MIPYVFFANYKLIIAACLIITVTFNLRGFGDLSTHVTFLNSDTLIEDRSNAVYDIDIGSDGRLYIPKYTKNEIEIFDLDLQKITVFPNVPMPHGLSTDDHYFYVATYRHGHVLKYKTDGTLVENWDKEIVSLDLIRKPVSIAVDASHNVFIADYELKHIVKTDSKGRFLLKFQPEGIDFLPHGLTTDKKEKLYVADRAGRTIWVFDLGGKTQRRWEFKDSKFDPLSVRFLTNSMLLVADYGNSKLCLFNNDGKYLQPVGDRGNRNGYFLSVTNVVVNKYGDIYTVEQESNRLQKINLSNLIQKYAG